MKRRGEPDHANGPPRQRQLVANQAAAIPPTRAAVMPESLTQRLTTVDALTYLREVKSMFTSQREVYETFLEIMKEFKAQTIDTYGVIQRVKQLFKGNKNLIIGFNTFLPKGFEIRMEDLVREEQQEALTQKQPVEFDQAINYVNKIKDRFRFSEGVYKNFLEILNQYRKAQKGIKEVYDQVAYIFRDHEDLLEEFTYFLPDSQAPHRAAMERQRLATVTRDNEQSSRRRGRGEQTGPYDFQKDVSAMFEKIRRRVANSTWNDFLKVLMLFVDGIITEQDLMRLVSCVIGTASNDLVQLFDDFMSRVEDLSFDEEAIDAITKAVTNKTSSHYAAKDKYLRLPISEVIDTARCEKLSVSYVQVPEDYPKLTFSARAKLPDSVKDVLLNDQWVSVTQGSEDYSFQSMRRNQYEDILFRIEDDRYDLELLIERNASVLRKIGQLMEKLAALSDDSMQMQVRFGDDVFSTIQKKHIGQVYGDGAEAMLNSLLNNPQAALPVVRDRLQSKGQEWAKTLAEMEVYWQRQFKQNYTRSLDHRSFYFKVIDKKVLGLRQIVQEIKDAAEATNQAPENSLSMHTSAPASVRLRPDVILEMPDKEVHGDVWALVQIGFVGSEVKPQVEQFWKSIVLPFFCVTDVASMTPDFGPPSPSTTVEADRSAITTGATPAVTPAQSAEGSDGAVAGNATGDQSGASSEAAGEGSAAAAGASDGADGNQPESAGHATLASREAMITTTAERSATAAAQGATGTQNRTTDDEEMVDRSDAAPEASEISKMEESDIDDGEEAAGGKGSGKDRSTVDEDEDEDDAPEAAPVNGLVPSTSVLPLEFEGGKGSSAVEPCPVCAQPQAELGPLKLPGEQEPEEILELYCNEAMYGFWRLYHHCYDRLRIARNCILEKHSRNGKDTVGSDADKSNGAQDGPAAAAGPLDGAQHPSVAGASYEAMRRKFFQLLYGHIVHKSDITAFEDTCRSMLGANSYVLFTIQKLVNKFARHLSGLIADDPSVKLINLHHYEKRRHTDVHWATRLANAAMTHGEDHAIRVVSRGDGSVAATWVDFERSDPPPLPCDPDAREFVERFMEVSESDVSIRQKARWTPKLYLTRNLHASMRKGAPPAQRMTRLKQCYIRNGLECKLKQDDGGNSKEPTQTARKGVANRRFSYKFNFVLDTEDAMLARKPAAEHKKALRKQFEIANKRHTKFLAAMRLRQEQMQQPHHIQHLPQVQRASAYLVPVTNGPAPAMVPVPGI